MDLGVRFDNWIQNFGGLDVRVWSLWSFDEYVLEERMLVRLRVWGSIPPGCRKIRLSLGNVGAKDLRGYQLEEDDDMRRLAV